MNLFKEAENCNSGQARSSKSDANLEKQERRKFFYRGKGKFEGSCYKQGGNWKFELGWLFIG